jgi:hypothetical protein
MEMKDMKELLSVLVITMVALQRLFYLGSYAETQEQTTMAASVKDKIKVTELKLKEETLWFRSNLSIPVVSGLKDKITEAKINNIFKEHAVKVKVEIEKAARDAYENTKNFSDTGPHKYNVETSYKVRYEGKKLLSITVMYELYTGGAHGLEILKGYTFDLETGNLLNLSDLFSQDFNYSEVIGTEVLNQMKLQPQDYLQFDESVIKKITGDHQFYLEDGKLVIYFDEYEIAPYSAGIPEFRIPSSKLKFKMLLLN